MTRKKNPTVIKLDRSTMRIKDVEVPMKRTKDLISTLEYVMPAFHMIYKQSEQLDFSGHKHLSDDVIRLQRNANSAIMLSEMLLDLLKCIHENQQRIIQRLIEQKEVAKKD